MSGLGNYLICKRFAVKAFLWSVAFVVQINIKHNTIAICENNEQLVTKTLFSITKKLNLRPCKNSNLTDKNLISSNFSNYVRINKIREVFPNIKHGDLNFSPVYPEDLKKNNNLNVKKSLRHDSIPSSIFRQCV